MFERQVTDSELRICRDQLIELLRQLSNGDLSYNHLLEKSDCFLQSQDSAVCNIYGLILEMLYDDINPDKSVFLSEEEWVIVYRSVIFLSTSNRYAWPVCPEPYQALLVIHLVFVVFDIVILMMCGQCSIFLTIISVHAALAISIHEILRRKKQRYVDKWKTTGDFSVWPFFNQDEHQTALTKTTGEKRRRDS